MSNKCRNYVVTLSLLSGHYGERYRLKKDRGLNGGWMGERKQETKLLWQLGNIVSVSHPHVSLSLPKKLWHFTYMYIVQCIGFILSYLKHAV